jgi:MFS family permease
LVDRQKVLSTVNLWQATVAIGLAVLGVMHLLNPYIILASALLFGVGFAFGSPASSAVIAEMVPAEDLPGANNLGGLQMNISGIVGPALGGLLIPIVGASLIFAFNGVAFLLVLVAILLWKRARRQSELPLESFFESFITAIRYVRYTPGIRIILARSAIFSFFISIISALMPVVGLEELHLEPANLGFLFTSMAIGSVVSSIFLIPWARSRFSPQRLTTYANVSLIVVCLLMATVRWTKMFLVVAALAGVGWTLYSTELWIAGQRAMPEWARGRMNATIIMVSQAATALGSLVWGLSAVNIGVVSTFLTAAGLAIIVAIVTRLPGYRLSIDFTKDLVLEQAPPATIFSNSPSRLPEPEEGPLSITTTFQVDPDRREEFFDLAGRTRLIYLRNGACSWHLKEDLASANAFEIEVIVPSWTHHLRGRERLTTNEVEVVEKLRRLHLGPNPPEEHTSVRLDKEVLAPKSQNPTPG